MENKKTKSAVMHSYLLVVSVINATIADANSQ